MYHDVGARNGSFQLLLQNTCCEGERSSRSSSERNKIEPLYTTSLWINLGSICEELSFTSWFHLVECRSGCNQGSGSALSQFPMHRSSDRPAVQVYLYGLRDEPMVEDEPWKIRNGPSSTWMRQMTRTANAAGTRVKSLTTVQVSPGGCLAVLRRQGNRILLCSFLNPFKCSFLRAHLCAQVRLIRLEHQGTYLGMYQSLRDSASRPC